MKKMKYLRTWLVVALVVTIIGSLTGGTVAWFTDSVEVTNNVIQSGNLDMVVEYWTADGKWATLEKDTKLFKENALYEPGYTETVFLRVSNAGNLAFKYKAKLAIEDSVIGKSVLGNDIKLSDYLEVGTLQQLEYNFGVSMWEIMQEATFNTREKAIAAVSTPNNDSISGLIPLKNMAEDGTLEITAESSMLPGENNGNVLAIVLTMPTTVGNEANHLTGTAAPQINLGLHVVATQLMHEEDSFGTDYDKDATYPEIVDSDLPQAKVTVIPEADLPTDMAVYTILPSFGTTNETAALDIGYVFQTTETAAEAAKNPYADWHADYVVTLGSATAKDSCGLAGQYDTWSKDWLAFHNPIDAKAGQEFRLLQGLAGIQFNYVELCEQVETFRCGVYNLSDENVGKTITVELRMYEPHPEDVAMANTNNERETGKYITLSTHTYTFEAVQDANK